MCRRPVSLSLLSVAGLAAACALALPLAAQEPKPEAKPESKADIPIQRVVMFNSGVSFYEHAGDVTGDATVDLKFNVRDINDLLKSMVLQDLGGGKISTVSYDAKDPITRTLQTFAVDLTENPTLAGLLRQLRGEAVEIDAPNKITGTIVGVETRKQKVGENETIEADFLTLLTEDGLRTIPLASVGKIKVVNPKIDAEFRQALAVLAMSHSTDKKAVSLKFLGAGKRPVRVGYIQDSPVWKTSYRLVLSDKEAPLLQGWAIVENTTEADWNNVNLSLVSGRPISFVMDLYEPLYVARPEERLELYASLRPRTYDQDLAGKEAEFRRAGQRDEKAALAAAPAPAAPGFGGGGFNRGRADGGFAYAEAAKKADADGLNRERFASSAPSVAQAGDVGEMFQYNIATPVTIARGRSAMLPIVNGSVEGEKVSIYNPAVHAKHPLNGLKFKNTTPLHLMQGPITVFDDGTYAGDAKIAALPPGSDRLISYAMDLDTEVAPTSKNEPEVLLSVKINQGTLYASRKFERVQTYVVKNSGKKLKNVLVEYPLDTAWTLTAPKEPAEKTRAEYRFSVKAEPGKPANLEIREERTAQEAIGLSNINDQQIGIFVASKVVSDKVKAALAEVVKRKTAINAARVVREELARQVQVIQQEQDRIRQNMAQLPKDSDLFRRYVTKFTQQEDEIEALRTKVTTGLVEEQRLQAALNLYLSSLVLE